MTVKPSGTAAVIAPEADALERADKSCRAPALLLFLGSAVWLLLGCLLGLLASLKFHGPGMAAGETLTYGRVYPAALFAIIFGGLAEAGIGSMIWLMMRQSHSRLQAAGLVAFAGLVWNLAILAGVISILTGNASGLEGIEFPRGVAITLLAAYLVMGLPALKSFLQGTGESAYSSSRFLLAALFWFPWILSTAILFLHVYPGRGAFQFVVAQWFSGNLAKVWLTLIAYAMAFYLVPKLSQKPLYSRGMATLTFWITLFFSSLAVVPAGSPVPAWIPGISAFASLVSAVAVLSAVSNLRHSMTCSTPGKPVEASLKALQLAVPCLLVSGLIQAISSIRAVGEPVAFTFFGPGVQVLYLGGFVGLSLLGAMIFSLPRISGFQAPMSNQLDLVVKLAAAGIGLLSLPLILGGMLQGAAAQNTVQPFSDALNRVMPFVRLSTIGWLASIGFAFLWLAMVGQTVKHVVYNAALALAPGRNATGVQGKASGVSA